VLGGGARRFKLVDPDGLYGDRAYDLAIPMRGWSGELLAGDALELGRRRCAYLQELTGADADAIWQWGFIERVSTGLALMVHGGREEGLEMLAVAERWS
jgi:streptomycin 6-kinase